jgi:hypothetical protein
MRLREVLNVVLSESTEDNQLVHDRCTSKQDAGHRGSYHKTYVSRGNGHISLTWSGDVPGGILET